MAEFFLNERNTRARGEWYDLIVNNAITEFHSSLPGYEPTPLVSLPRLAEKLGLRNIYLKDESKRFGVNAFKPLGASWAIFCFLAEQYHVKTGRYLDPKDFLNAETRAILGKWTFCAATDGNHGKAVAWTAHILQQNAVIYMPDNTALSRIRHIESDGAEVRLISGTFDACVLQADSDAKLHGWIPISDTAYEGYLKVPSNVMAGYSTIFREIDRQLPVKPTVVLLQAGVGGMASAGSTYFLSKYGHEMPEIVVVEPEDADAFLQTAKAGKPTPSKGSYNSMMAGLNCGVSLVAWSVLKELVTAFVSIPDEYAAEAMKMLYLPIECDQQVISGESGAAGMAGLIALLRDPALVSLKKTLKLNGRTDVLLINTEGDTDPINFNLITGRE
ncbi:MAG: diaminopropionate ammonia-lyase [Bacteroidetes bacterium]|nr:diaminopropionate ammonia-lyase [Bacteroidota bacterium]MBU1718822.1 diaminopropionate ammonia-lyase [Bacteroidota bacterium]